MASTIPKPTHLKVVTGNPGKRPLNKNEPRPKRGMPKCPARLDGIARRLWFELAAELHAMGVLTFADRQSLALLCEAVQDYRKARAILADRGTTYETMTQAGSVMYRNRPEVAVASDAWRRARTMIGEFGLTPAARSRIKAGTPQELDPFDDLLSG
jgi:P27 family predicted phage terminase small subunit